MVLLAAQWLHGSVGTARIVEVNTFGAGASSALSHGNRNVRGAFTIVLKPTEVTAFVWDLINREQSALIARP